MDTILKIIGLVVVAVALVFALSLLFAFPIKWLWNWLIPVIFSLPRITFWQAWGLSMLSGLLFKNIVEGSMFCP